MGLLELVGMGLNALPGLFNIQESQRRRENPPEVGRGSGTRGGTLSFVGGEEPRGGYQISPFIQEQIMGLEHEPMTVRGGFLGLENVPNPGRGGVRDVQDLLTQNQGRLTQAQAQDLAQQLRAMGKDDLASEIIFQAGQQSGGTNIDPGVRELIEAGARDVESAQQMADRDFARQLEALGVLQGTQSMIPELRNAAQTQFGTALTDERNAENRAIRNLQSGRLEAMLPLAQAQQLREEVMSRFDPEQGAVAAVESQREALDVKHREETSAMRARLQNDPAFAGQPALIEQQMRNLQFAQRNEMGTMQNGIRADWARLAADVDLQTANFVQTASQQAAGGLMNITMAQAQANDIFQARRTQLSLQRVANDVNLGILEREGRVQQAEFLRTMSEMFVPESELVQQAFAVNLQLEDRQLAFEQGTFQQMVGGFSQMGSAVNSFLAQQQADQAASEAGGGGFSAGGAATGAASGAASGAATGSVVPGIGTAVGAIAGGIMGAAGGGLS